MSLDNENWRLEVDAHYAGLMKAMRRKISELCAESEGKLANAFFVRARARNCVWCVMRLTDSDSRLFLLYGVETTSFRNIPGADALLNGDVGIEVTVVPWGEELLPLMKTLADMEAIYLDCCSCGHRLEEGRTSHGGLPVSTCPGCGLVGCDPSALDPEEI